MNPQSEATAPQGNGLTEAELSNFTTAFYSEIGDGSLTVEKLQQLANAFVKPAGTIPYDKIEAIVDALEPRSPKGTFDFPKMLRMLADAIRPADADLERKELIFALKAFDQDEETGLKRTGYIPTNRIAEMLKTYGGGIADKNMPDLLKRCDPENKGKVKVEVLADMLLS